MPGRKNQVPCLFLRGTKQVGKNQDPDEKGKNGKGDGDAELYDKLKENAGSRGSGVEGWMARRDRGMKGWGSWGHAGRRCTQ